MPTMPPGFQTNPYQSNPPQGYGQAGGMPGDLSSMGPMGGLLQFAIQNAFGQQGLVPGQFSGQQNIYDAQRNQRDYQNQLLFQQQGAQQDRGTYMNWMRNIGMTNPENLATGANSLAGIMNMAGQMFPEQVDALHGGAGSAGVMAGGIWRGGRFGVDPTTGNLGMGDSRGGRRALAAHQESIRSSYDEPGGMQSMHHFGMGAAGQIFQQMQQRGYSPATTFGDSEQVNTQNAEGMTRKIKSMTGSLRAMQEIFGSQGRVGSITELFQGLEQMTQGAAFQMSGAGMENLIRRAHATATTTQVGIDTVMATSAAAAQAGDPLGVRRDVSAQAGQFGVTHGAGIRTGGWQGVRGASDEATIRVLRAQTAARGAGSQVANTQASIMRLLDRNPELAKGNSQLAKIGRAIKAGETTVDGQPLANFVTPGGLSRLLNQEVQSGTISQSQANIVRENTMDSGTNQDVIAKYGIAGTTAQMQGQIDVSRRIFAPAAGRAISRTLAESGMTDRKQRKRISLELRPIVAKAVMDAGPEDLKDEASFNQYMVDKLRGPLARFGITGGRADQMARSIANRTWQNADQRARSSGYGGATQMLQLYGTRAGEDAQAVRNQRDRVQSQQTAMSDAGPPRGPIRRIMDLLNDPDIGEMDVGEFIGRALGGMDPQDPKLTKALEEGKSKLEELNRRIKDPDTPRGDMARLKRERNEVMEGMKRQIMDAEVKQGAKAAFIHSVVSGVGGATEKSVGGVMRSVDVLSGDEDLAERMGKSGKAVMTDMQSRQQKLRALAKKKGMTVAELLNDQGEDGKAARGLMQGITSDLTALDEGGEKLDEHARGLDPGDTTEEEAGEAGRRGDQPRQRRGADGRPKTDKDDEDDEDTAKRTVKFEARIGKVVLARGGSGELTAEGTLTS
jgi:hypothetical protein